MWLGDRNIHKRHVDLPTQQIDDRRRSTTERYLQNVDVALHFQQFAGKMRRASRAHRAIRELARVSLCIGDQFVKRRYLKFRMHQQHERARHQLHHGREHLERIGGCFRIERRIDCDWTKVRDQQGVAIRRGFGNDVGGQRSVGSGLAFHYDGLPKRLAKLLEHRSRRAVAKSARREGINKSNRLIRPILR